MPLYEYQCDSCGAVFEKMQKFADEPLKVHEDCGGPVHRLLTAPAFQFKGTGWYVTDYARAKSSPNNGAGKASESKTESTAAKTEAPAASSSTTTADSKSSDTKSSSDK
jgi:putative FmdB family regulatory protein